MSNNKINNEDKGMLVVLINLLLIELDKDEVIFTKEQFMAARHNKFSTQSNKTSIILKAEKKDGNQAGSAG